MLSFSRWTTLFLWALAALPAVCVYAQGEGVLILDDFNDPSAWVDSSSGGMLLQKTPDGLRVEANFSKKADVERISVDRKVALDLSQWNRFEICVKVENPAAFAHTSLYFHSQNGWFSCTGGLPTEKGRLVFQKKDFHAEGEPIGWDKIDKVRVSFWRLSGKDGAIVLREFRIIQDPVLFVSSRNHAGEELWLGINNTTILAKPLNAAGISHDRQALPVDASEEDWVNLMQNRLVIVLNYTKYMNPKTIEFVRDYCRDNGKIFSHFDCDLRESPIDENIILKIVAENENLRKTIISNSIEHATTILNETISDAEKVRVEAEKIFENEGLLAGLDFCRATHAERLREKSLEIRDSVRLPFRGWWNHNGLGAYKGDWARTARELKAAGFTAVFPNMLWAGEALYPSDLIPTGKSFEEWGDQLKACVEACRKEGLEVHVWKVNFRLQSHCAPAFLEKMRREGRLQKNAQGEEVLWLCPSHPDNFDLEWRSMLEIAQKYDVDGVHFDYIRYENGARCFCEGCRARFEEETGIRVENWPQDVMSRKNPKLEEKFLKWRAEQITRIVRKTHEEIKKFNPKVKVSAAVFQSYPSCYHNVGQNWSQWAHEGIVDFLCPMNYSQHTGTFAQLTQHQQTLVPPKFPLYPGIGEWRLTPDGTMDQIQKADALGCEGFMIFDLSERAAGAILPLWTR
ncbi:MAG: family 10 glycosylhydrolase [Planctomycetia bacterium]|nr:family 10 glycosylhydrolase [Planctomycetia bacterium]